MNCEIPVPSHMVWLMEKAKMKPPHLRRVTCHVITSSYPTSTIMDKEIIMKNSIQKSMKF